MIEVPLNTLQREQHPLSVCKVERKEGKEKHFESPRLVIDF